MNLKKSVKVMCAMHEKQQKDLAQHLKITNAYLSKLLGENNPRLLSKMAMFFNVSVSEFVKVGE
jgi:DNA-binding Xre family transcriptional regulator